MIGSLHTIATATLICVMAGCANTSIPLRVDSDVAFAQRPSGALLADIYRPEGSGPFPAVVVIHGGGWSKGDKHQMDHIAKELAARGMVVFNTSYRFAPANIYPAQLEDVRDAVRWLRSHAAEVNVDPARIGAFGYSAGAHLAMLLATMDDNGTANGGTVSASAGASNAATNLPSTRLQAVVAGGTPSDLNLFAENDTVTEFLGGSPQAIPEVYRDASPISHVTPDDPPTYLYHGKHDWVVGIEHAQRLAQALRDADVEVEFSELTFGHVAVFLFYREEEQRAVNFLANHLLAPAAVATSPAGAAEPAITTSAAGGDPAPASPAIRR